MGQKIINNLQNVTIGGSYTGGNSNNYFSSTLQSDENRKGDTTIFLSYNWHDQTGLINICQIFLA